MDSGGGRARSRECEQDWTVWKLVKWNTFTQVTTRCFGGTRTSKADLRKIWKRLCPRDVFDSQGAKFDEREID